MKDLFYTPEGVFELVDKVLVSYPHYTVERVKGKKVTRRSKVEYVVCSARRIR